LVLHEYPILQLTADGKIKHFSKELEKELEALFDRTTKEESKVSWIEITQDSTEV